MPPLHAQAARPWLDWRTTETEHFVFHYPAHYREWTLALAHRIEAVRTEVTAVVGFAPTERVHVVVDDPSNLANGAAFTPLDAPTIVLWPTPPDPRDQIGNYRVWGELLATHEFAHVAHLTRPSRNRATRLLQSLSPVPIGPIASGAPRWVLEGYATYVEGRVTGTGRPNHAWRAAILRQFALEGRLPGYAQLDATGPWQTGNFAYLAGSAFLEWLGRREGDSSVTALWRRMTARTTRSFDRAFAGVYGASPAELYGRFSAEVTGEALSLERTLDRSGRAEGLVVQHLLRDTGDPAISPDGRFVALVVRLPDAPSQLVVWRTADEPDTLAERRRAEQRKRDPEDVPDRVVSPSPRRSVITLVATDGAPYESPRWLSDNRHLLVVRRMPMADGTVRPDLFRWSAEDGTLERLTRGASIRDADPATDGSWAAAVRCDRGWCDLVRVQLATGAITLLRAGSPTRNYYRPRVSRTTGEIVVSEQRGDRWRIARVSAARNELAYADPDDGATRYDAAYAPDGRTIVTTSEASGIANLEQLDPVTNRATRLSSVTGAAVAADVAPDSAIWFLSLRAAGLDLHRLRPDSALKPVNDSAAVRLALVDSLTPILPPPPPLAPLDSARRPRVSAIGDEYAYGRGPTRLRYLPAATSGFGGTTLLLGLLRTDPVGRFSASLLTALGTAARPEGVSATVIARGTRTVREVNAWSSHEHPSRELPNAGKLGLDLVRHGGAVRLERMRAGDGGELTGLAAAVAERHHATGLESVTRVAGIVVGTLRTRQRDNETRFAEQLSSHSELGETDGGLYFRQIGALVAGVGKGDDPPSTLRIAYGSLGGGGGTLRESFALGGFASPLIDAVYDARRVDAPAYPTGSARGTTFTSIRVAIPVSPVELFYSLVSPNVFERVLRSYGVEIEQALPSFAPLGTPALSAFAGIARAVDEPVKGNWRYYLSVAIRP
ncbi:MAG: hypothetical protein H0W68_03090 [Gemmatimonadaceae bacterium]|nr:hypothetical protein [Gemmatimonadaceae bacterium]